MPIPVWEIDKVSVKFCTYLDHFSSVEKKIIIVLTGFLLGEIYLICEKWKCIIVSVDYFFWFHFIVYLPTFMAFNFFIIYFVVDTWAKRVAEIITVSDYKNLNSICSKRFFHLYRVKNFMYFRTWKLY